MVPREVAERCQRDGTIPLPLDSQGKPLRRNFVHVDDLVTAIAAAMKRPDIGGRTFNICMDEPVDYGQVADYLKQTRGLSSIAIASQYHSNWLDNSAAKFELDWRPMVDLSTLIDRAWTHARAKGDERIVWYPG